MGLVFGKWFGRFFSKKETRLLLMGLEGAGKSTLLSNLNQNKTIHSSQTIGFQLETIEYNHSHIFVFNIGCQEKHVALWRHYYNQSDGVIFVVDSADCDRMKNVREELHKLNKEQSLQKSFILIYANKQDLPNALNKEQITAELDLNELTFYAWHVQASIATTGIGVFEGIEWLISSISTNYVYK
jgi:small GTP-binding protein